MALTLENMWLGNESSLQAVINLNTFLSSPTKDAAAWWGDDDEDEESEYGYDGIGSHLIQVEGSVGIVKINGSLTNRYSVFNSWFGVISYDEIRDALVTLAEDSNISSILLAIDTGGGSAHGVNDISDLIREIDTKVKPVEAYSSMYVFSAGMWIASAARKISAAPISEQGSIGVIITLTSYAEMYKSAGVEQKYVRAGKHKALGQPAEPISEEVIALAEEKADKLYGYFLDAMIKGRPSLSITNVTTWAEGKTFFADQSIGIGLIDEILTFDKVVAKLSSNYDNESNTAQFSVKNPEEGVEMAVKSSRKKVLNEQELAAIAAGAEVAVEETEEEEVENSEETTTDTTEDSTDETTEEQEETEEASTKAPSANASVDTTSASLSAELKDAIKLNAKLEIQLEAAVKEKEAAQAAVTLLKPVVVQAVHNLQIALGQTPSDISDLSAESLVNMHTSARETFSGQYSVGGPKSRVNAESRDKAENTQFCPIHKPVSK